MARKQHDRPLPTFIAPMLAKPGQPFDSDDYFFEVKWDGTRVICFIEDAGYRLVNRRRADLTPRYPEFDTLRELPAGTVLDGEVVLLKGGKPDFHLLMSREQARATIKIRALSKHLPATYIVFDILYDAGRPVMDRPFAERRRLLEERLKKWKQSRLLLSEGVAGKGKELFRAVAEQGLEGVVAKRLGSRYLPGERSDSWIKIKRSLTLTCLVIGFLPEGKDDFRSLILAAEEDGQLQCVGKVGTGFDQAMRDRVNEWLRAHPRNKPLVQCKDKGRWVEPGLFCQVTCLERTPGRELRMPVFLGLVKE